jgi:hypothetical protein
MSAGTRPALDVAFVAPRDATEVELAGLWERVLGIGPLGVDDDFFDLGGESLHAFALLSRVTARFGETLTPRDLFAAGTIAGMAALLAQRASRG